MRGQGTSIIIFEKRNGQDSLAYVSISPNCSFQVQSQVNLPGLHYTTIAELGQAGIVVVSKEAPWFRFYQLSSGGQLSPSWNSSLGLVGAQVGLRVTTGYITGQYGLSWFLQHIMYTLLERHCLHARISMRHMGQICLVCVTMAFQ